MVLVLVDLIDPIVFGQLRLAAVERAQTKHILVITGAVLAQAGKKKSDRYRNCRFGRTRKKDLITNIKTGTFGQPKLFDPKLV